MRHRNLNRQRRIAAAAAVALAVALTTVAGGTSAFAQSASEDEDVPLDTKLMRQFLKDLGLRRDGEGIDYRERAPLVVPPSRNLPPPQDSASVTANPAWPKDPDVQQRKAEATKKKLPNRTAAETMEAEGGRFPAPSSTAAKSPLEPAPALPARKIPTIARVRCGRRSWAPRAFSVTCFRLLAIRGRLEPFPASRLGRT